MGVKDKIYDVAHKSALTFLAFITGGLIYDGTYGFYATKQRRYQWESENPKWDDDPFYLYNPNYMRFKKKDEEEIILTRPEYYAAKDLREKYGLVMQPPYRPVEQERALLDMDGNPIAAENDGYSNKVSSSQKK